MKKVLVCYFSTTGTTRSVANKIANIIGCETFEIVPVEKYSSLDIDYDNPNSRTSLEDKNIDLDVPILNKIENFDEYDTFFIGYPIWWLREPNIIRTFLKSYDFTNKTIVPFITSSSSGLGDSEKHIKELTNALDVVPGKRISSYETESSLRWFIDSSLNSVIK